MSAFAEAIISDRGGLNPVRVPIAGAHASWELSGTGSFSGFTRISDLREAGLRRDLKGLWLTCDFGVAGRFGGIITGRPTTADIAEIAAEGWASLARGRVATDNITYSGPGVGIAQAVLRAAGKEDPTFLLLDGTYDEGGDWVSFVLSGDVGSDALAQISDAGGIEWYVDADRRFHAGRKLGRDLSATVRLVEGRHVVDHRTDDDLWASRQGRVYRLQNELSLIQQSAASGVSGPPQWTTVQGEGSGQSQTGLLQFYEEAEAFEWRTARPANAPAPWMGVPVGIGANNPAIPGRINDPLPTSPVELTVANRDDCWRHLELGNTVRVDLGSIGLCGRFRVMSKGFSAPANEMTVAGEMLGDE